MSERTSIESDYLHDNIDDIIEYDDLKMNHEYYTDGENINDYKGKIKIVQITPITENNKDNFQTVEGQQNLIFYKEMNDQSEGSMVYLPPTLKFYDTDKWELMNEKSAYDINKKPDYKNQNKSFLKKMKDWILTRKNKISPNQPGGSRKNKNKKTRKYKIRYTRKNKNKSKRKTQSAK